MTQQMVSWQLNRAGEPLEKRISPLPRPGSGEVLLKVRACGLCHTDYGFLYGGVRPNAPLPLTLGHEIVGDVVATGLGCEAHLGQTMLVPAVLPCGACELCERGRGNVCRKQKMPGNDFHGGFASHFLAPARYLCPVPAGVGPVEDLSVAADAVGTAWQAVVRANPSKGDCAVVVGVGGVGIFAAQVARHLGARVIGIDVNAGRLEAAARFLDLPINARGTDPKALREAVASFEKREGLRPFGRRVVECSGTAAGQETAFSLLNHDGTLALVGFTLDKVPVRLSNLMAFDATAFGNWGCLPERFPAIFQAIRSGAIEIAPFVERFPMRRLNELLRQEHHARRPVLIPDFEETE